MEKQKEKIDERNVNVFENESVECIVWNAFRSNKASCRIAEKLGGKVVEGK